MYDKFLNVAKEIMETKYVELYGNEDRWHGDDVDFYKTQYDNIISPDNVNMNLPMFLDDDGTVNIIATIYSLAGSDSYEYILDTGL